MKIVILFLFLTSLVFSQKENSLKEDFNSKEISLEFNVPKGLVQHIMKDKNGFLRLKMNSKEDPTTMAFQVNNSKNVSVWIDFLLEDSLSVGDFTWVFMDLNKNIRQFKNIQLAFKKGEYMVENQRIKTKSSGWGSVILNLTENKKKSKIIFFLANTGLIPEIDLDFNPLDYPNWIFLVNSYGTILVDNIAIN